jgi:hypothetical protein
MSSEEEARYCNIFKHIRLCFRVLVKGQILPYIQLGRGGFNSYRNLSLANLLSSENFVLVNRRNAFVVEYVLEVSRMQQTDADKSWQYFAPVTGGLNYCNRVGGLLIGMHFSLNTEGPCLKSCRFQYPCSCWQTSFAVVLVEVVRREVC